jgi:hypothetical protein
MVLRPRAYDARGEFLRFCAAATTAMVLPAPPCPSLPTGGLGALTSQQLPPSHDDDDALTGGTNGLMRLLRVSTMPLRRLLDDVSTSGPHLDSADRAGVELRAGLRTIEPCPAKAAAGACASGEASL